MNILLVYPKYPDTYWSYKHVLKFVSKKAAVTPLGLITVSAMLPQSWTKKLVDTNIENLENSDLEWADYVFISAMYVQKESVDYIVGRCRDVGAKIVAGGPLFTQEFDNYPDIDHFILNEAEITMPLFLKDIESGAKPERIYRTSEYADITSSPAPDFHLLKTRDYVLMSIQVTRGCPFNCDFCEITALLGKKVRMKTTAQVLNELDKIYEQDWRGEVSIVDDNFIGNKKEIKGDLLPAMKNWMIEHNYPFTFNIQASINLADDQELMELLKQTGFSSAFIGIETPDEVSLGECNKAQNRNRDLIDSVKKIQQNGIQVSGGFIVGFDSDSPAVFQNQIDFIQKSGIVSAMVGLLNAPRNTKLYDRLEAENRLTVAATGNNTDYSMNFVPKMDADDLLSGYNHIIKSIYDVRPYNKRVRQFLLNYTSEYNKKGQFEFSHIKAFTKSVLYIGILDKGRWGYWGLFFWSLFNRPKLMVDAMTFAVYGYHYRRVFGLN